MKQIVLYIAVTLMLFISCQRSPLPGSLDIRYEDKNPQLAFAVEQITMACDSMGISYSINEPVKGSACLLVFEIDTDLGSESYAIAQEEGRILVTGGDATGLMYAGIDLAEAIRLEKDLQRIEISNTPYLKYRGLRFNIPLDARTPSYDDTGDAAQDNIATVWDFGFWKRYLDQMALNRYNLLTLWNLHPYPSWVKVPEYPDVALDNVCQYNKPIYRNTDMRWREENVQDPDNLEVIIEMTIDEKIAFWKKVFGYAEDRGIDIYLFHWNVFVNGAQGKHGIEWSQQSDVTIDYIRKSVKAMLLTYPNIKGIGVTAGEHINRDLEGKYKTENWMWHTYGKGVMDAKAERPDLDVRFIFRKHWSQLDEIAEAFEDYPSEIETSFKYSRARMYSSTAPPWFDKIYRADVEKHGTPCWLNVRNDDIFVFRWGNPEYAAEYLQNIPYDLTPGFYMGPDGYVWGKDFTSINPAHRDRLEVDKHWYRFRIWGRMAYDPDLGPGYWQEQLRIRYPGVDAVRLYETWKATSEIISLTDKIHFRQNDYQFLPEGCIDRPRGFHDVDFFIRVAAMPLQGVISIADYAKSVDQEDGITPFDISDMLDASADSLLEGARTIDPAGNEELKETLGDFKALAYLGKYYARKVRGATYTAMYRWAGDNAHKTNAVAVLEEAVEMWEQYAETAASLYTPQLFARTRTLDWHAILEDVRRDVEIARQAEYGQPVEVEFDNILWSRDSARL